jgi:hypothetical protein
LILARVHGPGKISRFARNHSFEFAVIPNEERDLGKLSRQRLRDALAQAADFDYRLGVILIESRSWL